MHGRNCVSTCPISIITQHIMCYIMIPRTLYNILNHIHTMSYAKSNMQYDVHFIYTKCHIYHMISYTISYTGDIIYNIVYYIMFSQHTTISYTGDIIYNIVYYIVFSQHTIQYMKFCSKTLLGTPPLSPSPNPIKSYIIQI